MLILPFLDVKVDPPAVTNKGMLAIVAVAAIVLLAILFFIFRKKKPRNA